MTFYIADMFNLIE